MRLAFGLGLGLVKGSRGRGRDRGRGRGRAWRAEACSSWAPVSRSRAAAFAPG